MKKIGILLFIIFSACLADSDGGFAGSFLRYGLDARSEAMGRSVTADSKNGFSSFYNPANLAFIQTDQFLSSYRFLSLDRKLLYAGFLHPISPKASIALGWLYGGTSDIEARNNDGIIYDNFDFNENMFHASFSLSPKENFSFGLNIKILYSYIPSFTVLDESVHSLTLGFDLGLKYRLQNFKNIAFGAAIRDFKSKYKWNSKQIWEKESEKIDNFPLFYDLGFSFTLPTNPNLIIDGGVEISENKNARIKAGAEYKFNFQDDYNLFLRAGSYNENLGFGLGFDFSFYENYKILFDYSFVYEDLTESNPHTISIIIERN